MGIELTATLNFHKLLIPRKYAKAFLTSCDRLRWKPIHLRVGVAEPRSGNEFGSYTVDERLSNFFGYARLALHYRPRNLRFGIFALRSQARDVQVIRSPIDGSF